VVDEKIPYNCTHDQKNEHHEQQSFSRAFVFLFHGAWDEGSDVTTAMKSHSANYQGQRLAETICITVLSAGK
jgi:hypothetical protein